jgi:hypothetical protein
MVNSGLNIVVLGLTFTNKLKKKAMMNKKFAHKDQFKYQ